MARKLKKTSTTEQLLEQAKPTKDGIRVKQMAGGLSYNAKTYEMDDAFVPGDPENPMSCHTTAEMMACLEKNKNVEIDARVIAFKGLQTAVVPISKGKLMEAYRTDAAKDLKTVRTRVNVKENGVGSFSYDRLDMAGEGHNPIPMLGGPFYKNQYFYADYIRMHNAAFYSYHHHPVSKSTVEITNAFTLGKGFRVDASSPQAQLIWDAFAAVNLLDQMMENFSKELCIYGEHMIWKLPHHQTKITYQLPKDQLPPVGLLPRVRLVDPSNIVEIITYPEDITRRLAYVWMAPTQYQIFSSVDGKPDESQPTSKFIYRQIPADQILHYKNNGVSNEKRGRSDYYAGLPYAKRLTDAVDFAMISHNKQSAWSIDTEVNGSQVDLDDYAAQVAKFGTIATPGSEFIHNDKVKRTFLANTAGRSGSSESFEWSMSMYCLSTQIPLSYYPTHLSGSNNRASAVVSTEPVTKKWELRQTQLKRVVTDLFEYAMASFGIKATCEVTFPDLFTADRSEKVRDIKELAMDRVFSQKRASVMIAKEMGVTDYDYDTEQRDIAKEEATRNAAEFVSPRRNPLSAEPVEPPTDKSGLSASDRGDIKDQNS